MSPAFDLGFLVFLNYERDGEALAALRDGVDLFRHAEGLGYDAGWVRVHHGARTLTAPFPFLTAAGLATSRIRLATAVIPIGYEDPLRFAEDAATTDLLTGGRLELGLSSGIPSIAIADPAERSRIVWDRVERVQAAIRGESLGETDATLAGVAGPEPKEAPADGAPLPHGPVQHVGELVALPRSPGLAERLWYGAGSESSVLWAARFGLDLVLSTIGNRDAASGPTLGHTQAATIERYREEFARHHPYRTPRVAVGRSILPIRDAAERAEFGGFKTFYDDFVSPDGRYADDPEGRVQASPLYSGSVDEIVSSLSADPVLPFVDELVLTPISELTGEQRRHVFASVAEDVAPELGWRRAAVGTPAA